MKGTKIKDITSDPIEPDMVLFGLIFVNFFPLKVFPIEPVAPSIAIFFFIFVKLN